MKFRNLLEVGSSLQKDTKVSVIPLLSSTLKKSNTEIYQILRPKPQQQSDTWKWMSDMTFVSSFAALTDVRGFNIYMIRRPTKRQKHTHHHPPPNGDHDSKKRCVSPAGTLAGSRDAIVGSRSWVKLSVFSYVFRWLFERNSVVEPTHFENGLLKLDHLPRLV